MATCCCHVVLNSAMIRTGCPDLKVWFHEMDGLGSELGRWWDLGSPGDSSELVHYAWGKKDWLDLGQRLGAGRTDILFRDGGGFLELCASERRPRGADNESRHRFHSWGHKRAFGNHIGG